MKHILSAVTLCVAVALTLFVPSGASAQIGCEVERSGGTSTFNQWPGGTSYFLWAYLLQNPCGWPGNATNQYIHITTPIGAGRCYDGDLTITYENRMPATSIIITSYIQRELASAPGGWVTAGMATVVLAPRAIATVTAAIGVPFEGAANEDYRVKGFHLLEAADPYGLVSFRVSKVQFHVWEVDCGGA